MKSLFSVDSKFGQVMCFVADLVLLNLLFLLCCIPIVTIGAAQSGLYAAIRPLRDPEDGRSCYKLFFKGFVSGFWRITLVWTVFLVIDAILFYTMWICFENQALGIFVHWGVPCAGLIFSLLLHSLTTIFHSQFDCSAGQLFRNTFLLFATNPFHSVVVAVLTWAPVLLAGFKFTTFADLIPLFVAVYYSLALLVNSTVMKKPFQGLIDYMNGDEVEEREEEE